MSTDISTLMQAIRAHEPPECPKCDGFGTLTIMPYTCDRCDGTGRKGGEQAAAYLAGLKAEAEARLEDYEDALTDAECAHETKRGREQEEHFERWMERHATAIRRIAKLLGVE